MGTDILLNNNLYLALLLLAVITFIKVFLFFSARSKYWQLSHFIFFSLDNIRATKSDMRYFIKLTNNFLTFSMIVIVATHVAFGLAEENNTERAGTPITNGALYATDKKAVDAIEPMRITDAVSVEPVVDKDAKVVTNRKVNDAVRKTKSNPAETSSRRNFTRHELKLVLSLLNEKRILHGVKSKCVQIIKSKSSNIANAFALASFIQKRGYVIAGRETKFVAVKGVRIDVDGPVFKIIVGTL